MVTFLRFVGYPTGASVMLGLAVATSSLAVTSAVLEDLGCLAVREARIIVAAATPMTAVRWTSFAMVPDKVTQPW
ncbi:MAG TPA: hypothetical protein VFZ25_20415 [Chloroflexota bacterium]|nr:hypothetical protein [Chloroflexota bacterium]